LRFKGFLRTNWTQEFFDVHPLSEDEAFITTIVIYCQEIFLPSGNRSVTGGFEAFGEPSLTGRSYLQKVGKRFFEK